eukprot:gene757-1023_t
MIGLRIGISEWDGGPFAYRTYCRQIANADWVGEDLPGWADLFGARRYAAIDEIEAKIADVGDILALLREENMCLKPYSLGVHCDGGYADHMIVPHPRYLIDLKGLDPVTAAPYACSGVTTFSALKKVEHDLGNTIVIIGAGGLGLMALSLLKAMGGKGAIVVDIDARKREAAEKAGALGSVDGAAPDALEQLAKKAGGPIMSVIDLVGNAATTQLGFDCLSKGGKLVIVGLFGGGATWALPLIAMKALTIQGSYVGNLRETKEVLELVRTKKVSPIPVSPMPLARANTALNELREGKLVGRAVLTP